MTAQILDGRYEIQQQLGKKTGRRTFLARDLQTQDRVVIKLLTFGDDFEWDDLKLFEREAEILQTLSHPAIPHYLNHFELEPATGKGFALVQSYIEAKSLEAHLKAGRTFSEAEVKQLAEALLNILLYLHERQPPVIHRDIKPSNILLGDRTGNHIGQVYLVDFGSVQTLAAREGGTMTVVGTYGYMPPEQFGGRAVPASDLYSLGATLIYLVTGSHPADLPQEDLRIQFEHAVNLSPTLVDWLKWMTEPSLSRRLASAEAALKALQQPSQRESALAHYRPTGSKVLLKQDRDRLEIQVPPAGFSAGIGGTILFAIAWNSFITFWTSSALFAPFPINLVFGLFSLPFWGVGLGMVFAILAAFFQHTRLQIDPQQISLSYRFLGFKLRGVPASPKTAISKLEYLQRAFTKDSDGDRVEVKPKLTIWAGAQSYVLDGSQFTEPELTWLAHELSNWLDLPISKT